jgi:hypothetical protein
MNYPHGTCMWHRGQSEDHVHGFATTEDRDAYDRGEPGPFERVLRAPDAPPVPDECRIVRAYLGGRLQAEIEHQAAKRGEHR